MKSQAYNTGTIELMPYPEHGEFVIVGVFAVDTARRNIYWRLLQSQKTKRLKQFFPELERDLFRKALKHLDDDWSKLAEMINAGSDTEIMPLEGFNGSHLFKELTRPREGMIRQQVRSTILTADIDEWMDKTFAQMVHRADATSSTPEEYRLTDEVKKCLKEWKVSKVWKARKIGNKDYHATFPFTYQPEGGERVLRAIKPLHLGQNTATKILDHGDFWLQKVRRLQQFKLSPDMIIFPVERPNRDDSERADHAEIVISDLKREGARIIDHNELLELRKVTLIESQEDTPLFARR